MIYAAFFVDLVRKIPVFSPLLIIAWLCLKPFNALTVAYNHKAVPDPECSIDFHLADSFRFMFYNTENLFDAVDDILTDDEEYLPGKPRGWTQGKYYLKLQSVAKVILSAGETVPPELVALCETENRAVAEALISLTPLSRHNYGLVYHESTDRRGIDICLLYDSSRFTVKYSGQMFPSAGERGGTFKGRPVLYVQLETYDKILHLFLNHWPSRRGGVMAGRSMREQMADIIISAIDSLILRDVVHPAVIIAGDFNCSPCDREIMKIAKAGMVNLTASLPVNNKGTYRYKGVWQYLDQILVSCSMTDGSSGFSVRKMKVHSPEYLLTDDPYYPGKKPFATYEGFRYIGGYSDHLPLIMTICH